MSALCSANTKVTKPKHLTLRADQDAIADVHTSRNGDLFIGLIDHCDYKTSLI